MEQILAFIHEAKARYADVASSIERAGSLIDQYNAAVNNFEGKIKMKELAINGVHTQIKEAERRTRIYQEQYRELINRAYAEKQESGSDAYRDQIEQLRSKDLAEQDLISRYWARIDELFEEKDSLSQQQQEAQNKVDEVRNELHRRRQQCAAIATSLKRYEGIVAKQAYQIEMQADAFQKGSQGRFRSSFVSAGQSRTQKWTEIEQLRKEIPPLGQAYAELAGTVYTGLKKTATGWTIDQLDGKEVKVYNSPHQTAEKHAICNQGSAYPDAIMGTCGCCSSGTIMNMAGFHFTEYDVVTYAKNNNLCRLRQSPSENGGTSPNNRQAIVLGMSGIHCTNRTSQGLSLEQLAEELECGHGVIIAVDAGGLPGYTESGGHAIVLASVVRDRNTNEIEGYYIYDSNGRGANGYAGTDNVCQYVPKRVLEMCYDSWGRRCNVTEEIIR